MFHPVLPSLVVVCILGLLNVVRADDLDYAYRYYPSGNELRVDGTKDSYDCPANCQSFYHATGCTIDDGSSKEKTTQVCSNRYAPSGASGKGKHESHTVIIVILRAMYAQTKCSL
ncbi:hypothetical protein Pst134EB_016350 [Puccinia striiformis f. sp. tritici]|nr:hypothetical protein Pst134EB_016350 [Puccinia striiformis f. sp. tritici]